MSGWARKFAGFGVFLFAALALYGMWGWFFGNTVRGVDLFAIFAGAFLSGACFVKFLQFPRAVVTAPVAPTTTAPLAATPSTRPSSPPPSPPVSKSGA